MYFIHNQNYQSQNYHLEQCQNIYQQDLNRQNFNKQECQSLFLIKQESSKNTIARNYQSVSR
jgi:hypothetical protein